MSSARLRPVPRNGDAYARTRNLDAINPPAPLRSCADALAAELAKANPTDVAAVFATLFAAYEKATGHVVAFDMHPAGLGGNIEAIVYHHRHNGFAWGGTAVAAAYAGPQVTPDEVEERERDVIRTMCRERGLPEPWVAPRVRAPRPRGRARR